MTGSPLVTTAALPLIAAVTPQPTAVPAYTLPPTKTPYDLAYALYTVQDSRSGVAFYTPYFRAALQADGKVRVPASQPFPDSSVSDDVRNQLMANVMAFKKACIAAYGEEDGLTIWGAGFGVFMGQYNPMQP